ncbi:MAG: hypothetical protein F2667_10795 [Actinobacteria bacterium]|uniref:Unannotated protein n=1 Tax=freshwater metagenome TaxID=449393 RepID=A0A6J6RM05_9ZZZZ|nr:hypothetical protein [Actinomycetota bacterium]
MKRKNTGLAAAAFLMALSVAGCSSDAETSSTVPPQRHTDDWASRAESFTTLDQLTGAAKLVVVGQLQGELRKNPYYGDQDVPFIIGNFVVADVVLGDVKVGASVELSLEGAVGKDGTATTGKMERDETYLLYLTPQGPRSPAVYTVVGYKAGMYAQTTDGSFVKVDDESPELPTSITLDAARQSAAQSR